MIETKTPKNRRTGGRRHNKEDTKREQKAQNALIERKKAALTGAISCPPAIQQFKQKMDDELKEKIENIFLKYKPETPEEKAERQEKGESKKELAIKFGIREVVKAIERKSAKFVLIANDVDPIVVVLFLPSLCTKMGVSYAIFDSKKRLGAMVGRKNAACIALDQVVPGMKPLMEEADELFLKRHKEIMSTWGKPAKKETTQ
ncbi:large subunit ribosomal protein L7Ae [Nematocida sp. AWRm77]|nr:large subunit ribosomal protein L7Ae [Nematocida sp. AWRm77]